VEPVDAPPAKGGMFRYGSDPRPDIQALVPKDARRILDLGCSVGAVGAALKLRQEVEVIGVELDRGYAADAEAHLDRIVVGNLDDGLLAKVPLGRFDCILAADVLEHLRDPWTVLQQACEMLQPGGSVIVSLPNVRHWSVAWAVFVAGYWPREAMGICDSTHLHWFTAKDALALLAFAGLRPLDIERIYWTSTEALAGHVPILREFFARQIVVRGTPVSSSLNNVSSGVRRKSADSA
jgi:methionine biosynthesis protein MetW